MGISSHITRLRDFYSRHGFSATLRRAALQTRRALFSGRMVIFYCDLGKQTLPPPNVPAPLHLQRVRTLTELSGTDLNTITSFWNPKQGRRNIEERFAKGATLWLVKSGATLAGYGWTLQGRTVEPYFFPLGPADVHLFDFHVFLQFRGQGLNPLLVRHILSDVSKEAGGRAFIEAAEWNAPQLSSLRKTAFRRLGMVRTVAFFGRRFNSWTQDSAAEGRRQVAGCRAVAKSAER